MQTSKVLKCISLFVYSENMDKYANCISNIYDRIIGHLNNEESDVILEALLCLRVMLYRIS